MTINETQDAGLLADICANPDDTDLRLIYADWLDENGQEERGEFIRLQIELANWPCNCDSDYERVYHDECRCKEKGELQRRERDLWASAADDAMQIDKPLWGVLPNWHISGWSPNELHIVNLHSEQHPEMRAAFRRGFVEVVTCTAADWIQHAEAITAAAPIREVTLTTWPDVEEQIGHSGGGWLRNLKTRSKRLWYGMHYDPGYSVFHLLAAEWPRIKFTLPET